MENSTNGTRVFGLKAETRRVVDLSGREGFYEDLSPRGLSGISTRLLLSFSKCLVAVPVASIAALPPFSPSERISRLELIK